MTFILAFVYQQQQLSMPLKLRFWFLLAASRAVGQGSDGG
jgi:hypothetical protein